MIKGRRKSSVILIAAGVIFLSQSAVAVLFEPGVGLGLEYTDNATLSPDAAIEDLITVGYVGARLSESEGALTYSASTALNKNIYLRDSYEDERFFNLAAYADWEMTKDRFNWFVSNYFDQVPIFSLESNTPDNLQDSNVFNFGANIQFPISARHNISLVPMFSQYYYEVLLTDNKQYSLAANWNYQMSRLTNIGLSLNTRKINYTETSFVGLSIEDTTFTTLGFTFNGERPQATFAGSLGSTNVKRDNGDETTGFSGFFNVSLDLSSRSGFDVVSSTALTDTSSVALSVAGEPGSGSSGVQITSDVIRDSFVDMAYRREDASLRTRISAIYRKVSYSEAPLDRVMRDFGFQFSYPVTQLLSSGAYVNYNRTKLLETDRLEEYYTLGGNLNYSFSRKLKGLFDLKYRTKESTAPSENYDEFSAFVSIVYGFGDVRRPTRAGGY